MKESGLFSPRLFREGFRQLKIPGVLMTIFYSLIVVIEPMNRVSRYYYFDSYGRYGPFHVDYESIFPVLDITALMIMPILVFSLFRFMMKRSTSDFYHSLPVSRVCLTVSFFASALAWLAIILLTQTVVGVQIHASNPELFVVDYSSIYIGILCKLAVGFLSGTSALLALSLTGTMMSGMVTAVLLSYVPMFVLMGMHEGVEVTRQIYDKKGWEVDPSAFARAQNLSDNLGALYRDNLMGRFGVPKYATRPIVFTFLVGMIVLLLAVLMMRFRKSEVAGKPAICQGVHVTVRISGTLLILWFVSGDFGVAISLVAIILASVAYLSYEILTTRRWRNLLKSLIWLPLVMVLHYVPYWCGCGITKLLFK